MDRFTTRELDVLAACLVAAIGRREHAGRAARRLTEPGLASWRAYAGNLQLPHLLALLAEDTAVRFPLPADPARVAGDNAAPRFDAVSDPTVFSLIRGLDPSALSTPSDEVIAGWAKSLGLPSRFAGSDLHKIQPASRVVEVPGSGGMLAARALERSPEAYLHTNVTVLTSDWRDRALAGLVAMELDTPDVAFVRDDPELTWATDPERRTRFDLVFGLQPEKGGRFDRATLTARFPSATVVLV